MAKFAFDIYEHNKTQGMEGKNPAVHTQKQGEYAEAKCPTVLRTTFRKG